MKKDNWWTKFWGNPWMGGLVVFGFLSVISFFQIDSYWADKHHFNGLIGWLGIGIVTGLFAAYCLYKVATTSTGTGG